MSLIRVPGKGIVRSDGLGAVRVPTPVVAVISGLGLSSNTGIANSPSGTVVGTLSVQSAGPALVNPQITLTNSAGGDFQLVGNSVQFLPNNVPAGNYTLGFRITADNAATWNGSLGVSVSAASTTQVLKFFGASGTAPSGTSALTAVSGNDVSAAVLDGNGNLRTPGADQAGYFASLGQPTDPFYIVARAAPGDVTQLGVCWRVQANGACYRLKAELGYGLIQFQGGAGGTQNMNFGGQITSFGVYVNGNTFTAVINGAVNNSFTFTDNTITAPGYVGLIGSYQNSGHFVQDFALSNTLPITYPATKLSVLAPSGGAVGTGYPIQIVAADGVVVAGATVTPTVSGVSGTFSPASPTFVNGLIASTVFTPSSAGTATINATSNQGAALATYGGSAFQANATGVATAATVQTFKLLNWGSGATVGFKRLGLVFAKGDIPAGSSFIIQRSGAGTVASQVDNQNTWSDGSLKTCDLTLSDISGPGTGGSYTYNVVRRPDNPFNNTSSRTLAQALSGHTLQAKIANLTETADGSNFTAVGSGAFTSDLASLIGISTRIEQYRKGPLCNGWIVWAMVTDNTGGAADPHLKANWYVDELTLQDGSHVLEVAPIMAQDWWSIGNKKVRKYDLALVDGATTIVAYTGVIHWQQSHWAPFVNDGTNNRGRRPWIGATAMDTLVYQPDRTYWISAGFMPDYDLTISRSDYSPANGGDNSTYTPGSGQNQRMAIDSTGAYDGRGVVPDVHAHAFVQQSAGSVAAARINGHAGMAFPAQYRSNRTRIRPGDAVADTANTCISLRLYNTATALPNDDFRAFGMPVAVEGYTDGRTPSGYNDGFVGVAGGGSTTLPGGPGSISGYGNWNYQTHDTSHQPNYSYFTYLLERERYHLEAVISVGLNPVHCGLGNNQSEFPSLSIYNNLIAGGAGSDQYSAIAGLCEQVRSFGWGVLVSATPAAVVPDSHVAAAFLKRYQQQQTIFIAKLLSYLDTASSANGYLPAMSTQIGLYAPWMGAFTAICGYHAYRITEDPVYKQVADMVANWSIKALAAGGPWLLNADRTISCPRTDYWSPTNLQTAIPRLLGGHVAGPGPAMQQSNTPAFLPWFLLRAGDAVWPVTENSDGNAVQVTSNSAVTYGQPLYVTSITAGQGTNYPTMILNTKADGTGTQVNLASGDGMDITCLPALAPSVASPAVNPPLVPNADDYCSIHFAVLCEARRMGKLSDSTQPNQVKTYLSNTNYGTWTNWSYRVPA